MSKIKAIISDADGTLVNTMYLIRHGQYEAAAIYLLSLGLQKNQIPKYSDYVTLLNKSVGGSTKDTFTKTFKLLLEKSQPEILKRIDFDLLDNSLSVIQDRIALLYVHPFHGLTELLTWMGTNKIKLGIFSSGYYHHIVRNFGVSLPALGHSDLYTLNSVGIRDRLEAFIKRAEAVYGIPQIAVITSEDVAKTKPDPEGILKLMDILEVNTKEVIGLGDHVFDMQASRLAAIHALGVSHGFSSSDELLKHGAIRVVDNLIEIPKIIETHNSGEDLLF